MAESVAFSLASKILSTIASPAFDKACERGLSMWKVKKELDKLRLTIESIQDDLLDAEKKQKGSAAVKNWIKRLKGVLYDAEDLFDEVASDDLLKQQMMEGKDRLSLKNKVRVSCSKLNPIVSRNSIAKQVKAIRKSLLEISNDMGQFGFVRSSLEEPAFGIRVETNPSSFVDPKYVFGRDEDKKFILEALINESSNAGSDALGVISIVGIGGMGKTTFAQLIYNDEEVKRGFEQKWFACISDTSDEKEVLGKIFQVVCDQQTYSGLTVSQLQTKIRESIEGEKFLLVLDDVWDEDHASWQHRMSLLGGGAKGSKIIVTTRSSSVAIAVDAFKTLILQGLSEDDSWHLFKRVAFTPERENDPRWTNLGREIVKKCVGVPLAIRSIGNLLFTKSTIQEWESIRDQKFSKLEQSGQELVMDVLQLSYDHLSSNLKHCFAYCSIFPKDFEFEVQKLVYLWIAQGYIRPNKGESVEVAGRSYFISLLKRSFFEEVEKDKSCEIRWCKMHDLVHDLAQYVAGEEVVMLQRQCFGFRISARHLGVDCRTVDVMEILQEKDLNMRMLRSLMLIKEEGSSVYWGLDQRLRSCKYLRALSLSRVGIEDVPSCIGEFKLLRYLDLSWNRFKRLPKSIVYLLNLVALDLNRCSKLEALPDDFRKLINLGYLNIEDCEELKHMPPGFGELNSLRYLSDFKVGRRKATMNGLDALARLGQLRGKLRIEFEYGMEDWDGDEYNWQPLVSLQQLSIHNYPGNRIPHWTNDQASLQSLNLVCIKLVGCPKVKYLPHFRYLPYLKRLYINMMEGLEYMEEEEEEEEINEGATGFGDDANSLFFPCLEELVLLGLSKLKGWSRRDDRETTSTPPPMPVSMQQQHPHLSFPVLSHIRIEDCPELKSVPTSALSLQTIQLIRCYQLKSLNFVHPEGVEELVIHNCPELGLGLGSVD